MPRLCLKGCLPTTPNPNPTRGKEHSAAAVVLEGVEAVLFDKDGTLIDFHAMWSRWLEHLVGALVSAFPSFSEVKGTFFRLIGWDAASGRALPNSCFASASTRDAQLLAAGCLHSVGRPWDQAVAGVRDAWRRAEDTFPWAAVTVAVPGADRVLKELKAVGCGVGVVTADTTSRAHADLDRIGVIDLIDVVLGDDAVVEGKPSPEMVWKACEELRVPPEAAVVVGDTTGDMRMAKAAGLIAVGVLTGSALREDLSPWSGYVVNSVADLEPLS